MPIDDEVIEEPIGPIDGANCEFFTTVPYQPGSLFIIHNGILRSTSDDLGAFETDPTLGKLTTKVAPIGSPRQDSLHVRYLVA